MCRLAAYIGPSIPLARVIIDPAHSLLEQSQCATEAKITVQGDGFGFAWYDGDRGPGLYRDVLPAWSDGNLPNLCQMTRSNLFVAHRTYPTHRRKFMCINWSDMLRLLQSNHRSS